MNPYRASTYKRPIGEQIVLELKVADAARHLHSVMCNCDPWGKESLDAVARLANAIEATEDPECEVQVAVQEMVD